MATQYIVPAFPFPIYVNDDGNGTQFILPGIYLNEVVTGGTLYTGSLSDNVVTSEGWATTANLSTSLADTAITGDNVVSTAIMLGSLTDAVGPGDGFTSTVALFPSLS